LIVLVGGVTFFNKWNSLSLPGNDLQDPATWNAPPLRQLKHVHEDLLQHYDCTDQPAAAQHAPLPPARRRQRGCPTRAQTRSLSPQAPRTTATATSLVLPQLNNLHTRHSSGLRLPPLLRLPALRTSPLLGPGPFRRNAVSPSSSPRNGPSTRTIFGSSFRVPDECTPIAATPLSATSAGLGSGLGLGLG
jgi:hypothetical protein